MAESRSVLRHVLRGMFRLPYFPYVEPNLPLVVIAACMVTAALLNGGPYTQLFSCAPFSYTMAQLLTNSYKRSVVSDDKVSLYGAPDIGADEPR